MRLQATATIRNTTDLLRLEKEVLIMFDFLFEIIGYSIAAFFIMAVCTISILFVVIHCLGRGAMFRKAGEAPWAAWIPFYSDYVMCRITMSHGYYFLFGYIPVFGWLANIVYAVETSLSFGQGYVFAVLYFFFPWICDMILGFGKSDYLGAKDPEKQLEAIFKK